MKKKLFTGFSPDAFDFLAMVRISDSKAWYDAHKEEYRLLLLEPFKCLVSALEDTAHQLDGQFVTIPAVGKTISRLRRDTRFTNDKSLYRDTMWFTFKRRDTLEDKPMFYFEMSPVHYGYGMGFYAAKPAGMQTLRTGILGRPDAFMKTIGFLNGRTGFKLNGDQYRRDRYPDAPEALKTWLNRKNLYVARQGQDIERLYSPDIAEEIEKGFLRMKPLYDFITSSFSSE